MRTLFLIAILGVSSISSVAAAQSKPAGQMASDDCAKQRKAGKTCVLSIESEEIDGGAPSGSDIGVAMLKFKNTSSLIRIRRDFIPEIIKTAEDL